MNPVLQSEGFEKAAYSLRDAINRGVSIDTGNMDECVRSFAASVEKLARILGMQAENDQRKQLGQSMAYVEEDFLRA